MASLKLLPPSGVKKEIINTGYFFEEIQSPQKISGLQQGLAHGLYISATVLYQLSYEDPNIILEQANLLRSS